MASVWKLKCPIHEEEIVSYKFIPISSDGSVNNEPIFFCEKCGCMMVQGFYFPTFCPDGYEETPTYMCNDCYEKMP